jgi:hypothetical protein
MTTTRPKRATKRQREMAAMFKAGAGIHEVAMELTAWPLDGAAELKRVENAIRAVLLEQEAGRK